MVTVIHFEQLHPWKWWQLYIFEWFNRFNLLAFSRNYFSDVLRFFKDILHNLIIFKYFLDNLRNLTILDQQSNAISQVMSSRSPAEHRCTIQRSSLPWMPWRPRWRPSGPGAQMTSALQQAQGQVRFAWAATEAPRVCEDVRRPCDRGVDSAHHLL